MFDNYDETPKISCIVPVYNVEKYLWTRAACKGGGREPGGVSEKWVKKSFNGFLNYFVKTI